MDQITRPGHGVSTRPRRGAAGPAASARSAGSKRVWPRTALPNLTNDREIPPPAAEPSRSPGDQEPDVYATVCSILVVDDDSTILQAVAEALGLSGYIVQTARNGAEALASVEQARPRMVLLDLRMPVMDGWEFVRVVRERQLGLKIVVMTATTDARRQAQDLAADAFLAKPFGIEQLMDVVERVCAQ